MGDSLYYFQDRPDRWGVSPTLHTQRGETTLLRAAHRSYWKALSGSDGLQRQQRAHTAVVWLLGAQRRLKIYSKMRHVASSHF